MKNRELDPIKKLRTLRTDILEAMGHHDTSDQTKKILIGIHVQLCEIIEDCLLVEQRDQADFDRLAGV